jgi:HlyD family type I secretion membrane fusion protein
LVSWLTRWQILAICVITLLATSSGEGARTQEQTKGNAIVAPGMVVASGEVMKVQTTVGGTVAAVLVREGARVRRGDALIRIADEATESLVRQLEVRLASLAAMEARLVAERDDAAHVAFPESLLRHRDDASMASLIAEQEYEFQARRKLADAEHGILKRKIAARELEIEAIEARLQSVEIQLGVLVTEKSANEQLLARGLTTSRRVMELTFAESELAARSAQLFQNISEAKQGILMDELEIERIRAARREAALTRLTDLKSQRSDLLERLQITRSKLDHLVLRAPKSGIVSNLDHLQREAHVQPGQSILDIVSDIIVEAHVRPQNVRAAWPGKAARLRFISSDDGSGPTVSGEVLYVSDERLTNERTQDEYVLVRVRLFAEPVVGFNRSRIAVGQPVAVILDAI